MPGRGCLKSPANDRRIFFFTVGEILLNLPLVVLFEHKQKVIFTPKGVFQILFSVL